MNRKISELSVKEVLALAIQIEQENGDRLRQFAETLNGRDPEAAEKFRELAMEEDCHKEWLVQKFNRRFKSPLPHVDGSEVEGMEDAMVWGGPVKYRALEADQVYQTALAAENRAKEFYRKAGLTTLDKSLFLLFRQLATMEDGHVDWLERKIQASV
jgi:rubrerythrin